jgi:hypothetical protein
MKPKNLIPVAAFIPLVPAVSAGSTWYVNGASGSDDNACKSPAAACKTIGHAISLAASGDGILVAEATYEERLTINTSVSIVGSSATTRIIDGQETGTVVTISNKAKAFLSISNSTVRGN